MSRFRPFRNRSSKRGFSLIEMLLVVAIIMVIASILVPKLIDAIHKAKQKRTMGELNLIGTAWMSWLTDQVGASSAGSAKTYNLTNFVQVSYPEIFGYLHPSDTFFYMQEVPERDAWGGSMTYWRNLNMQSDSVLVICASARDKIFDTCITGQTSLPVGPFAATDFDRDIIWADGGLVYWPTSR